MTLPITIAFNPIGTVITSTIMIRGAFDKSTFKNKSERPIALRIFILIEHMGVKTFAKHNHCSKIIAGSHLLVRKNRIKGSASKANRVIAGNIKKAVIFINLLNTDINCSLSFCNEAKMGYVTCCIILFTVPAETSAICFDRV